MAKTNHKHESVTIYDVAKAAEVSPATVSIVLNQKRGVSEATRKKVLDTMAQLHYTPNLNSRKLTLNKSFNIFVVFGGKASALEDLFYTAALEGVMEECGKHNYNTVISDSANDFDSSMLKRAIDQQNVDGVIFLQSVPPVVTAALNARRLPFVVLDAHQTEEGIPCVSCDYRQAAFRAMTYLIDQGHRDIAFMGADTVPAFHASMLQGYRAALEQAKLPYRSTRVFPVSAGKKDISNATDTLLKSNFLPDAIFCSSDIVAVALLQALAAREIRVPSKISVVAVDNIFLGQFCYPPLTTLDVPKREMGMCATRMLLGMIADGSMAQGNIHRIIPAGRMIVRRSSKRISSSEQAEPK
ncbi:MAG: LacI family DNA-binding transcriptional regulator [Clostridia bacterium]|nr:LacI family DNA-binding transcriptional regulator [Clostridia bacterium]